MFVLMVAVLPNLLSDQPPEVPQRVGLGDRFHYFRGASGRRYLFSAIPADELADFRSAVVLLARRARGGRLSAHWIAILDRFGRPVAERRGLPTVGADTIVLVHCLAESDADRRDLVADLDQPAFALAA
jgi:hypothetical protein